MYEIVSENEAAIDRIDVQLSELRLEQKSLATSNSRRTEREGTSKDGQEKQRGDNVIIRRAHDGRCLLSMSSRLKSDKAEGKADTTERDRSPHVHIRAGTTGNKVIVKRRHNGHRQKSISSKPPNPNPYIPTTLVKRATITKENTQDAHQSQDPPSNPPSPRHPTPTILTIHPNKPHNRHPHQQPLPPPPNHPAQTAYALAFPNGHLTIQTPGTGLLCGLAATIRTLNAMHPTLPHPTLASLQAIFSSPTYAAQTTGFNLTNKNNFHVDQIGAVLYLWGRQRGVNFQIGYLPEGGEPQLVPQPEGEGRVVVWVFHVGGVGVGGGHFEGMRARGEGVGKGEVGEVWKGFERRDWVKRLGEKLGSLDFF